MVGLIGGVCFCRVAVRGGKPGGTSGGSAAAACGSCRLSGTLLRFLLAEELALVVVEVEAHSSPS